VESKGRLFRERISRIPLEYTVQGLKLSAVIFDLRPLRIVREYVDRMAARQETPHQRALWREIAGAVPRHHQNFRHRPSWPRCRDDVILAVARAHQQLDDLKREPSRREHVDDFYHTALRCAYRQSRRSNIRATRKCCTPAMAAGVTDRLWSVGDLLEAVAEKAEAA